MVVNVFVRRLLTVLRKYGFKPFTLAMHVQHVHYVVLEDGGEHVLL